MDRAWTAADRCFFHRASAFFIALSAAPLHDYARSLGVVLFDADVARVHEWYQDRQRALEQLEDEADAVMGGPLSPIAEPLIMIVRRLRTNAWREPAFMADVTRLAERLRRFHVDLSKGGQ